MKDQNPFTLTFGKHPGEYIERYENKENVVSTFAAENPVSQTFLLEGIRGSGKTVLMTSISREFEKLDEWIVVDLNAARDLLKDLAVRLENQCRKLPEFIKSGFQISIAGFGIGINGTVSEQDEVIVIEEMLSELRRKGKRVLITIDEIQHDQNMRSFASEFQLLIRKDLPVYLLMTGLYENIYAIQNDPALTFLLRTPKIHLAPLGIRQIAGQYAAVFHLGAEEANRLAKLTKGYAFAFQALGMLCYEHRETAELERILPKLDDMLDDFVYKKIWQGLSGQDRRVLKEIPEKGIEVRKLRERLSMSSGTFSRYRDRLMKQDLIVSPQYGSVAHALPRFANVIAWYEE